MIKQSDGKIGSREFFVLILYILTIKITDMTPSFLFKEGKNATWAIPIISGIVILLPFLATLSLLKKHKNKGLVEIAYTVTGKYIGFIIGIFLFLFYLLVSAVNTRNYVDIMLTMFFPKSPLMIIFILLMSGSYFIANRGLESIGRTAWFFYPILSIVIIIFIYLSFKEMDTSFLFPLAGPGIPKLFKTSVVDSPILSDAFLLTTLFPFARSYKDFRTPVLIGLGISVFVMSGFYAIIEMVYDYKLVEVVAFPFQQLTALVKSGRFISNIEGFFFFFWIIATVIRFAIYLYITTALFAQTMRIKEFEPLLLPITWLVILLGMIPKNSIEAIFVFRQRYLIHGTWIIFILLPLTLWTISKIRRSKAE